MAVAEAAGIRDTSSETTHNAALASVPTSGATPAIDARIPNVTLHPWAGSKSAVDPDACWSPRSAPSAGSSDPSATNRCWRIPSRSPKNLTTW